VKVYVILHWHCEPASVIKNPASKTVSISMCPPTLNRRRIYCPREISYLAWLDTALCATSVFYSSVTGRHKLRHVCYHEALSPQERRSYELLVHHYLHIGTAENFEICDACNSVIAFARPYLDCATCRALHNDFAEYFRESGDDPYNSPEATVITISRTVA